MKRIALIADSHYDSSPGGRLEECIRIHDWIADDLAARNVQLALHSGDVLERKSTAVERNAIRAWAQRVTRTCPLIIVRGNHDPVGDLDIFGHLRTEHQVQVVESVATFGVEDANAVVGCLAWPTKASVLAAAGPVSHEESEQIAADALRNVLRGLGHEMDALAERLGGSPARILLSHAMVRGSMTSTGQPLVGCDLEVGLEDLRLARADLYALGHIHMPQEWRDEAGDVVYPGSPRRTAYGETEDKGYVLISVDDDGSVTWERVLTPCTPMILAEAEWADGGGLCFASELEPEQYAGADVRVRYSFPSERRDAAVAAAERLKDLLLDAGALVVKLDPHTVTTSAARAPEVAKALTLADKLRAYWKARDTTPEPERAGRLLGYAHELEQAS